ncbi:hypothetical protein DL98DRAFT_102129 [Cadophora sp. DSE1049]|nr:hypothetical protein DL98DRAFT_102129 [Cadophora sp. DSE1049]
MRKNQQLKTIGNALKGKYGSPSRELQILALLEKLRPSLSFLFSNDSSTISLPNAHCNFKSNNNSFRQQSDTSFFITTSIDQLYSFSSTQHPPLTPLIPIPSHLTISLSQQPPTTATMVRTRRQNPNGIQSPLRSMGNQCVARPQRIPSPPRGAVFPPGMAFFYDENVGLYDDDVSTLDLEGSVRAQSPSGAMAVRRSPSVASDGMVHIDDEGDDESQISEPAVEIRLSDDEEEDDNAVIIIPDDDRSVISISSDSESESSDDDISDLDLAAGDENENEDHEEDASRTSLPPLSIYSASPPNRNISPDHTISVPPSPPNNYDPDRTISAPPTPNRPNSNPPSPDRTISVPSTPNHQDDGPVADPDQTESEHSSPRLARDNYQEDEDEDEEMSDDGIVDFQGPDLPPYVNQAPSHFVRTYRGITTIWSVVEWERDGPAILAEEAAERERERLRRRRRANNGGRSRLARQRAWRERQRSMEPRARVNGRFA